MVHMKTCKSAAVKESGMGVPASTIEELSHLEAAKTIDFAVG